MAASVLNSNRAIKVSVFIVRAFIPQTLAEHRVIAKKLEKFERKVADHDDQILTIFEAIKQLIAEDKKPKRKIGYVKEKQATFRKKRAKN
jgi:predicted subunit of tRNA(5-methylaminomethyl-2-thiouridylate) methyltransferase